VSDAAKDDGKRIAVTVRVMGREYSVECPADEHEALVVSAEFLNDRMMAIRKRGKALGTERIAVMVALNIARELLQLKGDGRVGGIDPATAERVRQLRLDIDSTLATE
jgi:cell division protein ZapA